MGLRRSLLAFAFLLAGCVGQATNQAEVYRPASGVLELQVTIPAGESVTKVQFQVNGQLVSEDADGTDGFKATIDTLNYADVVEALIKVAAVGVRADNTTVVLRENFILVAKKPTVVAAAADATATPTTAASATADKTASPTTAASGTKKYVEF